MKVLIACENASMRMSGETLIPLYYFRAMRQRDIDAHLLTHERTRAELRAAFDDEAFSRIHFIPDTAAQRALWAVGRRLNERVRGLIVDQAIHLSTQLRARRLARRLVREHGIDVVFEPAPISPKGISCMFGLGAPVVVGPLCGGLEFPPGFRFMDSGCSRLCVRAARAVSPIAHRLLPGKTHAAAILVGNPRTVASLPRGCRGQVHEVVESGVDLRLFEPQPPRDIPPGRPARFAYFARFVDWKGIEYLVEAFARLLTHTRAELELIGDGELYEATRAQVERLGIEEHVRFHGRLSLTEAQRILQSCDAYVAPSLRECGGCALLEAMAMGMPIIATDWAGPAEFLGDDGGAILVDPASPGVFVAGLEDAMRRLATEPDLRRHLSYAAQARVRTRFYDWDSKADRVIEILRHTAAAHRRSGLTSGTATLTPPAPRPPQAPPPPHGGPPPPPPPAAAPSARPPAHPTARTSSGAPAAAAGPPRP